MRALKPRPCKPLSCEPFARKNELTLHLWTTPMQNIKRVFRWRESTLPVQIPHPSQGRVTFANPRHWIQSNTYVAKEVFWSLEFFGVWSNVRFLTNLITVMVYKATALRGLANAQMVFGALMFVFGIASIFFTTDWTTYVGFGIWVGVWVSFV